MKGFLQDGLTDFFGRAGLPEYWFNKKLNVTIFLALCGLEDIQRLFCMLRCVEKWLWCA